MPRISSVPLFAARPRLPPPPIQLTALMDFTPELPDQPLMKNADFLHTVPHSTFVRFRPYDLGRRRTPRPATGTSARSLSQQPVDDPAPRSRSEPADPLLRASTSQLPVGARASTQPPTPEPEDRTPQASTSQAREIVAPNIRTIKISRPKGASSLGKKQLLQKIAMGSEGQHLADYVSKEAAKVLDPNLSYEHQEEGTLRSLETKVLRQFPALNSYEEMWPLKCLLIIECKNSCLREKNKIDKRIVDMASRNNPRRRA
ncbi:hypothetical protein K435DRAFT_847630 [Dendrothele bispora CBS 962.96]|uniref:Uncharacterized protein n=1 Tax=Dendrothele bispora (strain CBS 962.96) TaxID=1314807 RepID=A0A4S8MXH2_DENBC|nr:hypothetical protein K435DRAFT_847630 [Dendrothele bispora CBS 962.96]